MIIVPPIQGRRRKSGESSYLAQAVTFDGTSDYMQQSTISTTNNKTMSYSFWIRPGKVGAQDFFDTNSYNRRFVLLAGNNLELRWMSPTLTTILSVRSNTVLSANTWYHVMFSCDMSDTGKRHLYINGSLDSSTWNTYTNDTLDFNRAYCIGSRWNTGNKLQGDLSDFWYTNEYIDLSQSSNREKFITAAGEPVYLGITGTLPTGNNPLIWFEGEALYWNAGLNSGTSGPFTMYGSVTDSANEPVEVA